MSRLALVGLDTTELVAKVAAWTAVVLEHGTHGRAEVQDALECRHTTGENPAAKQSAPHSLTAFWGGMWLLSRLNDVETVDPLAARSAFRRATKLLAAPRRTWTVAEVINLAFAAEDPWINTTVPLLERPAPFVATDRNDAGAVDVARGRITAVRQHAGVVFADVAGIQVLFDREQLSQLVAGGDIRRGDWVAVAGRTELTQAGTYALRVDDVTAHAPTRLDRRRVAAPRLTVGPIRAQAVVLRALRDSLQRRGFDELTTPLLTPSFYGGRARPFQTRWNAVNEVHYLRLTSELALKAAVASGIERCYEIGPSCRNEGRDPNHLPVFTVLEAYAAGASVEELVEMISDSVALASDALGVDAGSPVLRSAHELVAAADPAVDLSDVGAVYRALEAVALPRTTGLTVVVGLPAGPSPLITAHDGVYKRAWIALNGMFFADVADEEVRVDVVQRELVLQLQSDPYCVPRDYSGFLEVLACGMPPTAGVGLSVPRLVAGLTGVSNLSAFELRHWAR